MSKADRLAATQIERAAVLCVNLGEKKLAADLFRLSRNLRNRSRMRVVRPPQETPDDERVDSRGPAASGPQGS